MHVTPTPNGKKIEIVIYDSRIPPWFRRILASFLMAVIPVAIGIHFNSTPMQWVGFVFAIIAVGALGAAYQKQNTYTSIDTAIAELESMKDRTI